MWPGQLSSAADSVRQFGVERLDLGQPVALGDLVATDNRPLSPRLRVRSGA